MFAGGCHCQDGVKERNGKVFFGPSAYRQLLHDRLSATLNLILALTWERTGTVMGCIQSAAKAEHKGGTKGKALLGESTTGRRGALGKDQCR